MALKSKPTSFWKFNPRFYRGTRPNVVFRELYWVLSFEFLAIALLLGGILYYAIPESIRARERRDREIERRRLEKLTGSSPAFSAPHTQDDLSPPELPATASSADKPDKTNQK